MQRDTCKSRQRETQLRNVRQPRKPKPAKKISAKSSKIREIGARDTHLDEWRKTIRDASNKKLGFLAANRNCRWEFEGVRCSFCSFNHLRMICLWAAHYPPWFQSDCSRAMRNPTVVDSSRSSGIRVNLS